MGTLQAEDWLMVDYRVFQRFHPNKPLVTNRADDLGEAMNRAEPLDDEFLTMMPPKIHAFDFAAKAWSEHRSLNQELLAFCLLTPNRTQQNSYAWIALRM